MCVQLRPASAERYRPLGVGVAAVVSASTTVYMTSGLLGAIATMIRPFSWVGKPFPLISVHVRPASVVFQRALPGPPLRRKYGPRWRSQLVAQRTFGSRGSMAMSTKPALSLMNFDSVQFRPPSVVL